MSSSNQSKNDHHDATFRKFGKSSAAAYAAGRIVSLDKIIETVISHHRSANGEFRVAIDVGCGPGTATRLLAQYFDNVIGVDPGEAMIEVAKKSSLTTRKGKPIHYELCGAEEIDKYVKEWNVEPGTVDLITAASSAHWFDLEKFYVAAARILRPGGMIAMWCPGRFYVSQWTTPNARKVQDCFDYLELKHICDAFVTTGNRLANDLYADLLLPWTCHESNTSPAAAELKCFSSDQPYFARYEYNRDGHLLEGETFMYGGIYTFEELLKMLGSASPVIRWRQANQTKLEKGEIKDCVVETLRYVKMAMEEVEEGKDRDWIEAGSALPIVEVRKMNNPTAVELKDVSKESHTVT